MTTFFCKNGCKFTCFYFFICSILKNIKQAQIVYIFTLNAMRWLNIITYNDDDDHVHFIWFIYFVLFSHVTTKQQDSFLQAPCLLFGMPHYNAFLVPIPYDFPMLISLFQEFPYYTPIPILFICPFIIIMMITESIFHFLLAYIMCTLYVRYICHVPRRNETRFM